MSKDKVRAFNNDVLSLGSYAYTRREQYSAVIATKRQTDELVKLVKSQIGSNLKILDAGCGDGVYTFELYKDLKPKKLVAFDFAEKAIKQAQTKAKQKKYRIDFEVVDIYKSGSKYPQKKFDLVVVRGVLHHLDFPEKAVKELTKISDKIIVLEPNGYNPLLKIIEKTSSYHIVHQERSYWPPEMNSWFEKRRFEVKFQKFFSIVPYFCPKPVADLLKKTEPFFESVPVFKNFYSGTNLIYYQKSY